MTQTPTQPVQPTADQEAEVEQVFTDMAQIIEVLHALDSTYRCVRCDAQAYVEVQIRPTVETPKPGDLYFCAHHYREHSGKLVTVALKVIDHRAWLQEQERLFSGGTPIK